MEREKRAQEWAIKEKYHKKNWEKKKNIRPKSESNFVDKEQMRSSKEITRYKNSEIENKKLPETDYKSINNVDELHKIIDTLKKKLSKEPYQSSYYLTESGKKKSFKKDKKSRYVSQDIDDYPSGTTPMSFSPPNPLGYEKGVSTLSENQEDIFTIEDVLYEYTLDDYHDDGCTILINTIKNNDYELVEKIIDCCANLNLPDKQYKRMPIIWAIKLHYIEIAQLLIRRGCDLNVFDENEITLLHLCIDDIKLKPVLSLLLENTSKLDVEKYTTKQGNSPLHVASLRSDVECIEKLLSLHSNPDCRNKKGETPLHIACRWGNSETVRALLKDKRVDVNCKEKEHHNTPLHMALSREDEAIESIVKILMENRANGEIENKYGKRPGDVLYAIGPLLGRKILKTLEDYDPMSKSWKWEINRKSLHLGPQIGEGRFGVVYKGELYGTDCAVKIIRENACAKVQIQNEIGLMGDIHHPNILAFFGTCRINDSCGIITEYIDGGCLSKYIMNNRVTKTCGLQVGSILKMSLDIARGIAWLHSRDPPILHRDLHSQNILVTSQEVCKVGDFGLSYVKGGAFANQTIYSRITPPELKDNLKIEYTVKADVYMYGLILFEMITGEKGTMENTTLENLNYLSDTIELDVVRKLMDVVRICLSVNPKDRYTFEDIVKKLKSFIECVPPQLSSKEPLPPLKSYYV